MSRTISISEVCDLSRKQLQEREKLVRDLMQHPELKGSEAFPEQHGEMRANIMLAIRHIEDARMRLGKVIQYAGSGVSKFDKNENADPVQFSR